MPIFLLHTTSGMIIILTRIAILPVVYLLTLIFKLSLDVGLQRDDFRRKLWRQRTFLSVPSRTVSPVTARKLLLHSCTAWTTCARLATFVRQMYSRSTVNSMLQ